MTRRKANMLSYYGDLYPGRRGSVKYLDTSIVRFSAFKGGFIRTVVVFEKLARGSAE